MNALPRATRLQKRLAMKKISFTTKYFPIFAAVTILLPAISQAQTSSVDPKRVVATIDGTPITGEEYYHRMERLTGVGTLVGQNYIQMQPGVLTLNQLISEHLLLLVAQERGVAPKDDEVEAAYRDALTQNPSLEKNWLATGQTKEELLHQYCLLYTSPSPRD